jgi:diaminopimelate epimerase
MVAAGNDFLVIERTQAASVKNLSVFAKNICDRKYAIGADGVLLLEKSKIADTRMRVFNADGSEAEMCGNGARCTALWVSRERGKTSSALAIQTRAGIIKAVVMGHDVRVNLTDPRGMRLDMPIKIAGRSLKVNFINTGVPHAVIFTEGLDGIRVAIFGRQIRHHAAFGTAGTNVDFIEVVDNKTIKVRTYERGVEDETLACGTGVTASAIVFIAKSAKKDGEYKVRVMAKSGETLKVYFDRIDNQFTNVWLQGPARICAQGEYYV